MSLRPLVAFALAGCAGVDTYTLAPWIDHVPAPGCATDPAVGSACGPGVAATAAGADYATLADALAGAPAGATVSVCPGKHPGPFEVVGRELVAYAPEAGATILSGGGAPGPVLTLEDATAWGLTVEGGGEPVGDGPHGAVFAAGTSPVAVVCGTVRGNDGGAVGAVAPLRLHGTVVAENHHPADSSGVVAYGGLDLQHGALHVDGSYVIARDGLLISDTTFTAATEAFSGTLLTVSGGVEVPVLGSRFEASPHAEGLSLSSPEHVFISGSTFDGLDVGVTMWVGPALRATVLDSEFTGSAVALAAAVPIDGDRVTDLWNPEDPQPVVIAAQGTSFVGHDSEFGAVAVTSNAVFDCDDCTFEDNAPCDFARAGVCEDVAPAFFW